VGRGGHFAVNRERLDEIQEEIEKEQLARDLMIKLALLQAAVTLRTFLDRREAVAEARAIWEVLNDNQ
jgi:hypothetical protein